MAVSFYCLSNSFDLPVIECHITSKNSIKNQVIFAGYSCHFSKYVAVTKALHEALQSLVGLISGARDDLKGENYNFGMNSKPVTTCKSQDFEKIRSYQFSLNEQVDYLLDGLKKNKIDLAVYSYLQNDISILRTFFFDDK